LTEGGYGEKNYKVESAIAHCRNTTEELCSPLTPSTPIQTENRNNNLGLPCYRNLTMTDPHCFIISYHRMENDMLRTLALDYTARNTSLRHLHLLSSFIYGLSQTISECQYYM